MDRGRRGQVGARGAVAAAKLDPGAVAALPGQPDVGRPVVLAPVDPVRGRAPGR